MGKIKLNLVSGAVVEKPLINAFKANNNDYVVLDNELNGSMGLPIILVCKFENNKLTKIVDQNEWNIVKEYLKNIIAGNQIEFIKVEKELAADDIYYTQLTLPVPSFDALKNAYKVEDNEVSNESVMPVNEQPPVASVAPEVEQPAQEVVPPVVNDVVTPQVDNTPVSAPVMDMPSPGIVNPTIDMSAPVINEPVVNETVVPPVTPVNVSEPVSLVTPVTPANPVIEPTPSVVEPVIENTPNMNTEEEVVIESRFAEQKEAFMQACENMFDALVQKFEKELQNK